MSNEKSHYFTTEYKHFFEGGANFNQATVLSFGTGEDNQLNCLLHVLIDISSAVRVAQSSAKVFVPLIKMYQQKPLSFAVAPYGRDSKGELHSSMVKYECVLDAPTTNGE